MHADVTGTRLWFDVDGSGLGHSLGSFVAMVYAIRHADHPNGLVLQSAFARFDLDRIVDEFHRAGGEAIATTASRVCVGELDPITPVAAAREIVDALPPGLARLEVFEGAGHFAWKDAPDRSWPLLTEFVASTAGGNGY